MAQVWGFLRSFGPGAIGEQVSKAGEQAPKARELARAYKAWLEIETAKSDAPKKAPAK